MDPLLRNDSVLMLTEHVLEPLGRVDEARAPLAELVRGQLGRVAGPFDVNPSPVEVRVG